MSTLLDSGMTAADVAPVVGLDVRRVRAGVLLRGGGPPGGAPEMAHVMVRAE